MTCITTLGHIGTQYKYGMVKCRRASSLIISIANILSPAGYCFCQILLPARSSLGALPGSHWQASASLALRVPVQTCACVTEGERWRQRAGGGAANWLFCGSVTLVSTRGTPTGAQRPERPSINSAANTESSCGDAIPLLSDTGLHRLVPQLVREASFDTALKSGRPEITAESCVSSPVGLLCIVDAF